MIDAWLESTGASASDEQALGGLLVLVGVWFVWRSFRSWWDDHE